MKKILTVILILSTTIVFSQEVKESSFFLRSSVNYFYQHKDRNDIEDNFDTYNIKYGTVASKFEFGVNSAWQSKSGIYYGLGLLYNYSKDILNPESDLPDLDNDGGYTVYPTITGHTHTGNGISPLLFVGFNKTIFNKLSFSLELYGKYDFINGNDVTDTYQPTIISYSPIEWEYKKTSNESDYQIEYINFGLMPSLRYNFTKTVGLEFAFGRIHYSKKMKDTRIFETNNKSSEIIASFKPMDWRLSFYLGF